MNAGARLSVTELRHSVRHPVEHRLIAAHRERGDLPMHIANISARGFMIEEAAEIGRGDRVVVRLPTIGRIEAHCIWTSGARAGFQFERIIRDNDFDEMLGALQPNPALRRRC